MKYNKPKTNKRKTTQIHIENRYDIDRAVKLVREIIPDGKYQVTIEKKAKDRSSLQNRLSHKWYSVIGKQTFESEKEVKNYCKLSFGIPIMIRDVEGFAGMWAMQSEGMTYEQEKWSMKFMKLTSILSVEQMTYYLTQMKLHYEAENIHLPTKDDLYYKALGYGKMTRTAGQ